MGPSPLSVLVKDVTDEEIIQVLKDIGTLHCIERLDDGIYHESILMVKPVPW